MRTFLLVVIVLLGPCPGLRAQENSLVNGRLFPEAALVLTTGTLLQGTLRLYPDQERVTLTCANDSTYSLPAQLVQGFAVKDPLRPQRAPQETYLSAERVFRSFPLAADEPPPRAGWGFYEQLSHGPGPVLLLRREQALPLNLVVPSRPESAGSPQTAGPPLLIIKQVRYVYRTRLYLRTATGGMIGLRKPQNVLKYLPQQAPRLRAYARENGLHYATLRDLALLIDYANTLLPPTP
ncbi:hypothetical protein GKZ68_21555 (plasmid) [Hymenobacter sp. BRD128]|uniref:hypothetical protein n=1 Tax=Hymenobacter sp. BRD128 TaxID=2675878 RepID=UPI001564BE34|nr:hypothetical protein [Hymenobacter sp. BRD128]QKG59269.1 hypothetical protein GKZ68_21555 [Hymenobacter sp. BRD128]